MTVRVSPAAVAATVGFLATVVAANWLTEWHGMVSVGFGLTATAGTYAAGLAFGLRDALHEVAGRWAVVAVIAAGAVLSALISPQLALASGVAFLVAETADLAVYDPLRQRQWTVAVVASNLVGALVDTVVFLWLAGFPVRAALGGQMVGKALMILPALVIVGWVRRR